MKKKKIRIYRRNVRRFKNSKSEDIQSTEKEKN